MKRLSHTALHISNNIIKLFLDKGKNDIDITKKEMFVVEYENNIVISLK